MTVGPPELRAPDVLGSDPLPDARILVVDDEESNLLLMDRVLRSAGAHDVHGVSDAREAVDRCLELRPDVLLLDLHMPHLDGIEVLERLAVALDADTFLPVLVLTADTTGTAKRVALEAGAKDFLTKPIDRQDVLLRLRNHLHTAALYRRVRAENQRLQAQLDRQERAVLQAEEERDRERGRVLHVLHHEGIEMVFQPVVDLLDGRVVEVEALARFSSATGRTPDVWFAEASRVGLGVELEVAAVQAAIDHLPQLPEHVLLAVNVSPHVVVDDAFGKVLAGVPCDRLVVELTENVPIDDYDLVVSRLAEFRSEGVRIAVDDAGAGYAGLQHLVQLQPEFVKLDRELTVGIDTDPARRAMAASMVHFAGEIGARVVGEGIENQAATDALRNLGVTLGQGYHLARPAPLPLVAEHVDVGLPGAAGS
jgi:EAL domain-containing protein (putative c-di-GMP-specific phosphodiesterase class I)